MEEKKSKAQEAFEKGAQVEQTYGGCGQCVLYALIESGLDISKDVFRAASGMAAGVGRQGETCGAVAGAMIALGMRFGFNAENASVRKEIMNGKRAAYAERFCASHGCLNCKGLLGYDISVPEELEAVLDKGLMFSLCPRLVKDSIEITRTLFDES